VTTVSINVRLLTVIGHGLKLAIGFGSMQRCIILQLDKEQYSS
jgi:hypothetical protein